MSIFQNTYPVQRIPFTQKNKKWKEANISFFIGRANLGYSMDRTEYTGVSRSANRNRIYNMLINYDIYNGRFLKSDIEYIVNPFGQDESQTFPTTPQNINIVRPAIDYLIGEKATKSSKFMVLDTSPEMVEAMTELKKNMIVQNIISETQNFIDPENQEETIPMDKIDQYIHYTHKNIYEKAGQFMLNRTRSDQGMDEQFVEAWKDSLIAGENCFYVGHLAGDPIAERVNPAYIDFERHPDMNRIDDADWLVRKMYMSPATIFNTWKLSNEDMDHLSLSAGINIMGGPGDDMAPFIRKRMSEDMYMTTDTVPVYHCVWASLHQVGFITSVDEDGNEKHEIVGEGYKLQPNETVDWEWDREWWEGYRIGDKIYKDIRPIPYGEFPYVGNIVSNTNSENISLVGLAKPLQYWFIEVMYRLQLTLARDKGKIINIDVTQIPKSLGIDFKTWVHYLSYLGINLVNPYEEGWDIKRGGNAAAFNQFGSIDLTMANVINEYIMLLSKIESMLGRVMGVPDQRLGEVKASENVGNVQQVLSQSAIVTEPYYIKQASLERRVYTKLLNLCYKMAGNGELKMLSSFDNVSREFITIPEDIQFRDMGIFVSNSNEDFRKMDILHRMGENAVQTGASLSEAATMILSDSVAEIKANLKKIDADRAAMEQAQAKAQEDSKKEMVQMELDGKQKDRDLKQYEIDQKNITAIRLKEMDGDIALPDQDMNQNGTPDFMETAKISLEQQKQYSDNLYKDKELNLKDKELNLKDKEIKSRETTELKKADVALKIAKTNKNRYSSK